MFSDRSFRIEVHINSVKDFFAKICRNLYFFNDIAVLFIRKLYDYVIS